MVVRAGQGALARLITPLMSKQQLLHPTLSAIAGVVLFFGVMALVVSYASTRTLAGETYSAPALKDAFVNHTFFSATTTSATSTNAANLGDRVVRLDGADQATFYFSRGGATGPNWGI